MVLLTGTGRAQPSRGVRRARSGATGPGMRACIPGYALSETPLARGTKSRPRDVVVLD
ncbi:hypothetical protein [Ornithinimicrobium kibberense]|uniref:hypothetical protein n=1 Tax=Ornithinimicrobium kibberense TaxID=282060 RepID=UPI0036063FA0